jgi:subtilase family serine protease
VNGAAHCFDRCSARTFSTSKVPITVCGGHEVAVRANSLRRAAVVLFALIVTLAVPCVESISGLLALAWAQPYEGFGASTPGGTVVVPVTNLNDSGAGSFREAVESLVPNRRIVFNVSGTIQLASAVYVKAAFITIDGFDAPSPGITLHGGALVIRGDKGAHDVIVRGLRVRDAPLDGIQVANGAYNVVIDHVSVSGSGDGNIDITEDSHDVTVSWSILASPASEKNMLIKYNASRISLHHNLFFDSTQRNPIVSTDDAGTPAIDTTVDIRNNVVWSWGFGFGIMIFKGARANVVANFTSAPESGSLDQGQGIVICDLDCDGDFTALAHGHALDNLSGDPLTLDMNAEANVLDPFPAPAVTTQDAYTAAQSVLTLIGDGAGARPLDAFDTQALAAIVLPPRPDGPNLSVSFLSVTAASNALTISDRVTNSGSQAAGPSTIKLFLSVDAILDPGDVLLTSRSIGALAAGESNALTRTVPFPPGITGTFFLIANADSDHVVAETSEIDNSTLRIVTINGFDLVVSALSAPASAVPGGSISVTETTKNLGSVTVASTKTTLFLSTDTVVDAGDVLLGTRTVPSLAGGKTSAKTTTVTIPAGKPAGSYYLLARADADDDVAELSETNNTTAHAVVLGADLMVQSMTAPVAAVPGENIKIRDTTKNLGAPVGATTTRIHLSTDPVLDAGDVVLGSRPVPALAAGGSSLGNSVTATIPPATAAGTYYILARADADDLVAEANEGNNVLAHAIEIGLDLAISSFSAPTSATVGATIQVTDTTKNLGAGTAPGSTTAFFLSINTTLSADDILLGSRPVPQLTYSHTSTAPTSLTLPAGLAGDYRIIALANANAGIGIGASGNNVKVRTLRIGPDLMVPSLTTPSSAAAGTTVPVSDTTRNGAAVPAPASVTTYFLAPTSTLGPGAIPVGTRSIPALPASTGHTGSATIVVPAGTPPGSYFVIAKSDGNDMIVEYSETNNTRSRAITIVP